MQAIEPLFISLFNCYENVLPSLSARIQIHALFISENQRSLLFVRYRAVEIRVRGSLELTYSFARALLLGEITRINLPQLWHQTLLWSAIQRQYPVPAFERERLRLQRPHGRGSLPMQRESVICQQTDVQ